MNKYMNYNFNNMIYIMGEFQETRDVSLLNDLKKELNKFFNDSRCLDILYTKNTDKPFFGMCVIPLINGDTALKILTDDDKVRLNRYYIEFDSKLFDIDFTARELTAMLLHEIGHLVNDSTPSEEVRNAVNVLLMDNNDNLIISDSVQYKNILAFGLKNAISNLISIFNRDDDEFIADQFSVLCGFGPDLESAFKKIIKNTGKVNKGIPKFIAMQWTLRLYKDVKIRRISALHSINKAKKITGSELQKRELSNLDNDLNKIKDKDLVQESINIFKNINKLFKNFKYRGLRDLQDDLYEINLRVKNCDDNEEAITLLKMINTRMSIIDDYIRTEQLEEKELDRWSDLLAKYNKIRTDLSNKNVYEKQYGLFVKQPVIKQRCLY